MRRTACVAVASLALASCGLPSKDRVQDDLQTIAGAPPEVVTVEVTSVQRGEGDFSALEHIIDYDLKVWRNGPLFSPLIGGMTEARAGQHWTGGRVTLVYVRNNGPWRIGGVEVIRPARPPATATAPAMP